MKFLPAGIREFFFDIFQDQDGGASMKRTVFLLFAIVFCAISGGVYFKAVDPQSMGFLKDVLGYIKEILTWLGGFIFLEKAPAVVGAVKGSPTPTK